MVSCLLPTVLWNNKSVSESPNFIVIVDLNHAKIGFLLYLQQNNNTEKGEARFPVE